MGADEMIQAFENVKSLKNHKFTSNRVFAQCII